MRKKRIPWNDVEADELVFVVEQECFDYDWEFIAARLNSGFHNARTPAACQRKYGRMNNRVATKERLWT